MTRSLKIDKKNQPKNTQILLPTLPVISQLRDYAALLLLRCTALNSTPITHYNTSMNK